jgi:hypothetical protein
MERLRQRFGYGTGSGVVCATGYGAVVVKAAVPKGLAGDLLQYLQQSCDAVLRGLDGLDTTRRPLTPAAVTIPGLAGHLAGLR